MSLDTPPQHPARYVAIPDTPLNWPKRWRSGCA